MHDFAIICHLAMINCNMRLLTSVTAFQATPLPTVLKMWLSTPALKGAAGVDSCRINCNHSWKTTEKYWQI
jgi:hypothetical protein